jgi:hypothetical protein
LGIACAVDAKGIQNGPLFGDLLMASIRGLSQAFVPARIPPKTRLRTRMKTIVFR